MSSVGYPALLPDMALEASFSLSRVRVALGLGSDGLRFPAPLLLSLPRWGDRVCSSMSPPLTAESGCARCAGGMAEANRVSSRSVGDHRDVLGLGKGSVSKDMAKAIWVGSRSCGVPRVGKGFLLVPSFSFSFLVLSRKLFLWLPTHAPVEGSQISKGAHTVVSSLTEKHICDLQSSSPK